MKLFRLGTTTSAIMFEAQAVIAMRLWGMAGVWAVSPTENTRMVTEKVRAAQKGMADASLSAMRGNDASTVMAKAIQPVRRATRSNMRRLQKGNPMLPKTKGS